MEKQKKMKFENQPITDPDVQRDYVHVRGEDGELHEIEVPEEEVTKDAEND